MPKLLVKKRDGSVHVREKSIECIETIDKVHPNKIKTWLEFGSAAHDTFGGSMEDVITAVIERMSGQQYKPDKPKIQVTPKEYNELMRQCLNKSVPRKILDSLVEVVEPKGVEVEEIVIAND